MTKVTVAECVLDCWKCNALSSGLTAVPVNQGRDAVVTIWIDRDVSDKSESFVGLVDAIFCRRWLDVFLAD